MKVEPGDEVERGRLVEEVVDIDGRNRVAARATDGSADRPERYRDPQRTLVVRLVTTAARSGIFLLLFDLFLGFLLRCLGFFLRLLLFFRPLLLLLRLLLVLLLLLLGLGLGLLFLL